MKIGIITWFHYENYGTALQAVALQHWLRSKGFDVELIKYIPKQGDSVCLKEKKKRNIKEKVNNWVDRKCERLVGRIYQKQRNVKSHRFRAFLYENIHFSELVLNQEDFDRIAVSYDILICGSDQIWNPQNLNRFYFLGTNTAVGKKISYAASLGNSNLDEQSSIWIKALLESFYFISVREESYRYLSTLLGNHVETVVDPTMLITSNGWKEIIGLLDNAETWKKPAIVCLFLTDNVMHWRACHKLSDEMRYDLRIIPYLWKSYFYKGKKIMDAGPKEFVKEIALADCIVTDSFHAVVFAIIFHKEFYVFERFDNKNPFSQNERIRDLLEFLGLGSRIIRYNSKCIRVQPPINYQSVVERLQNRIDKSKELLLDAICN